MLPHIRDRTDRFRPKAEVAESKMTVRREEFRRAKHAYTH
jgi:hypothetical protein